jgi:hypothetical protein
VLLEHVKHLEKFHSAFSGDFIPMHIPIIKEEGSFTTSFRVRRKSCLVIGVRSLTLEEYVEEPPPPTPYDLHILKFMIMFSGSFTMGKADGMGVFPNCGIGLDYHIVLGPLFQECPCHGALLHM